MKRRGLSRIHSDLLSTRWGCDMQQDNASDMKYFVTPGVVELTPAALKLARAFADHVAGVDGGNWIVTFGWCTRRAQTDRDGKTTEFGPGLDLGAHHVRNVPAEAIWEADGVKYAMQIPSEIVARAEKKIIDVDPLAATAVRLL